MITTYKQIHSPITFHSHLLENLEDSLLFIFCTCWRRMCFLLLEWVFCVCYQVWLIYRIDWIFRVFFKLIFCLVDLPIIKSEILLFTITVITITAIQLLLFQFLQFLILWKQLYIGWIAFLLCLSSSYLWLSTNGLIMCHFELILVGVVRISHSSHQVPSSLHYWFFLWYYNG